MQQEPPAISLPTDNLLVRGLEWLSDEEFWQFALEQAKRTGESAHNAHGEEYVECVLDDRDHRCWLALAAMAQALPSPQRFALLPAMPPWMIGLLAWRGETLAVIDVVAYLADSQQPVSRPPLKGNLVIINDAGEKTPSFPSLALFVADIRKTTTIAPEQIQAGNRADATDGAAGSSDWLTPLRTEVIRGSYDDAPVLDMPALLADIVERIGIAALDE